jgi:hypothetical protein
VVSAYSVSATLCPLLHTIAAAAVIQVSAADLLQRIQALRAGKAAAIEEEQLISTEMARIQREQKVLLLVRMSLVASA